MTPLDPTMRYAAAPDVARIDAGPISYLCALPHGLPVTLSGPAVQIWDTARGGGTPEQILAAVAHLFDQPAEAIRADLHGCLTDLVAAGLLRPDPEGAPDG